MQVKDHPILFNADTVKAILEGKKTQTRRPLNPQPLDGVRESPFTPSGLADLHGRSVKVPYRVGDRLWVRETWACGLANDGLAVSYRADLDRKYIDDYDRRTGFNYEHYPNVSWVSFLGDIESEDGPWKPSIHMPRWASRITTDLTEVRVQRLSAMTIQDIKAEGIEAPEGMRNTNSPVIENNLLQWQYWFGRMWNGIYGNSEYAELNDPWVIALTFLPVEQAGKDWKGKKVN